MTVGCTVGPQHSILKHCMNTAKKEFERETSLTDSVGQGTKINKVREFLANSLIQWGLRVTVINISESKNLF